MGMSVEDHAFVHGLTALAMSSAQRAAENAPMILGAISGLEAKITRTDPSMIALLTALNRYLEAPSHKDAACEHFALGRVVMEHHMRRMDAALRALGRVSA